MLKNYFLLGYRHLRKHRGYAAINIAGLAVGLACCGFIVLYILNETRYDRFHESPERIYRVVEDKQENGRLASYASTYGPLAPAMQEAFPGIESTSRIYQSSLLVLDADNTPFQEDNVLYVDSCFFEVFSFELVSGERSSVLNEPYTVILSESASLRYFGVADPIGEVLQVKSQDSSYDLKVTGVVEDAPLQSHIKYDFLVSFETARRDMGGWIDDPTNWDYPPLYTYVRLRDTDYAGVISEALPAFTADVMGPERAEARSHHLQKLTDIRLNSNRENELLPVSNIIYIYIFSLVCGLILLIACANFVNLSTARAADRLKEMGVRRSMGARRPELIRQLLGESFFQVLIAVVLAVVMVETLLRFGAGIVEIGPDLHIFASPQALFVLLLIVVSTGLLAGLYPALYLTSSDPTDALRGRGLRGVVSNNSLRRSLVAGQFAISVGLILATIVVHNQLRYVQNDRLGFDKENVIMIPLRSQADQVNHDTLIESLERIPEVVSASASSGMPGLSGGIYDFKIFPGNSRTDSLEMLVLTVDHNYVETFGLDVISGRDFSEDIETDATSAFLINEAAAAKLGWSDPVGQELTLRVWLDNEVAKPGQVVGVVRDFQYGSLHRTIEPILLHIFENTYYNDFLSVRLASTDIPGSLASVERAWNAFNPDRPFEYTFLDEQFDRLYTSEQKLRQLFSLFAGLAIMIACLGLVGLAAFSVERRTKEIGIRKVLGASVANLVAVLSAELLKPVVIALILGSSITYLFLRGWLETFAYRVQPGIGVFVLTGAVTLGIGILAIGYQSLRAARKNPVQSLRYE